MAAEWEAVNQSADNGGPWPVKADPMVLWQQWRTPAIDAGLPVRRLLRLDSKLDDAARSGALKELAGIGWVPVWPAWPGVDYLCVEVAAERQGQAPSQVLIGVPGVLDEAPAGDMLFPLGDGL